MKEGPVHLDAMLVPNQQAAEGAEPRERALDLPAAPVAAQGAAVLSPGAGSVAAMGSDQLHAPPRQIPAQRIAVAALVPDQAQRLGPRPPRTRPGDADRRERRRDERDLRRGRRGEVHSKSNTFALNHHHALRTLAPLGFSDCGVPLVAGKKEASMNASSQPNRRLASSSVRKARQTVTQAPSSSQRCNRRQQVAGLGYRSGRSRQRAPVLSTQRMPPKT